jgi:hypothetical protein
MKTALLWNTYAGDLAWFDYSVRSYRKFAWGFHEAVCFVPSRDRELFQPICDLHGIRLAWDDEWPGQGFLFHEYWQCRADMICDRAEVIFHIDSDTCFAQPVGPHKWFHLGKVIAPCKRFADYDRDFGPKMWKPFVDEAIGGDVQLSTMVTPPYVHVRGVYAEARRMVERLHPEGFEAYVKSRKNDFPQTFCEFETLGAVAQSPMFSHLYHWHNVDAEGNPFKELVAEGWSHGGLDQVNDRFGDLTARQKFATLGLL